MSKDLGASGSINICNIFKDKLKEDFLGIPWNTSCLRVQKQGPPCGFFCCLLLSVKSLVKGTSISQDQALLPIPSPRGFGRQFSLFLFLGNWKLYGGIIKYT